MTHRGLLATMTVEGAANTEVFLTYLDRMSLRGIHRTFGVCYTTVMKWLGKKADDLPAFVDTLLPSKKGGRA